ncbi:MAG: mechanosensitive ion channel family protein [Cycloclasticus sp.]|nr:mechanosensitive ion channel family protein [Cycloclasticus sp.]
MGGSISAQAETNTAPTELQTTIQTDVQKTGDTAIAKRIRVIFDEIPSLKNVTVSVEAGVVSLLGTTINLEAIQQAENLVARVDGVVTINNKIERDLSIQSQLEPALKESKDLLDELINMLPLMALAAFTFFTVIFIGNFLAQRSNIWNRISPNIFITELIATTLRIVFIIIAFVLALNILGATALLSAVLGSAGVVGLAVGFAIRDTIENYIASIMLSLRQPFRPKDHIVINDKEGRVVRLTSRATILMTLDGNHLRIPNAEVFKSTILNYTTNPERRFEFELGVDADDDPLAAIQIGLENLRILDCVLKSPPPRGVIKQVGDSNIVINYAAWINQQDTDFGRSRSLALATVKDALEEAGFGLPEPIYRLRFDPTAEHLLSGLAGSVKQDTEKRNSKPSTTQKKTMLKNTPKSKESFDITPDQHLDEMVDEERREIGADDLLDEVAPIE